MEDEDASRPLSINPSRHYREADGPVSIEDSDDVGIRSYLPNGSGRPSPHPSGSTSSSITPPRASRSRSAAKAAPRPCPIEVATANSSGATPVAGAYQVTTGTCEAGLIIKRFVGSSAAAGGATKAAFPKPAEGERGADSELVSSFESAFRLKTTPSARAPLKAGAARRDRKRGTHPSSAQTNRAPPSRAAPRRPRTPQVSTAPPRARLTDGRAAAVAAAEDRRPYIMNRAAVAERAI